VKNVLVTGGAGFIGSNFVKMMVEKYPDYNIINLDALTYAGNLENLSDIDTASNYTFVKADIRDREEIEQIFKTQNLNFCAFWVFPNADRPC